MIRTPSRFHPLERQPVDEEERERRSGSSPLRVHFLDFHEGDREEEKPTNRMSNNEPLLSIAPPPESRLGKDLYKEVALNCLSYLSSCCSFPRIWIALIATGAMIPFGRICILAGLSLSSR
jgi:hypothetical protein